MHGDQQVFKNYVCGFAFGDQPIVYGQGHARSYQNYWPVLLLVKAKPQWQAGHLNGVGGKIELGESPRGAMAREFQEETGLVTESIDWSTFHVEHWRSGVVVHFLMHHKLSHSQMMDAVMNMRNTVEPLQIQYVDEQGVMMPSKTPMLYNIRYLVAMAHAQSGLPEDDRPL